MKANYLSFQRCKGKARKLFPPRDCISSEEITKRMAPDFNLNAGCMLQTASDAVNVDVVKFLSAVNSTAEMLCSYCMDSEFINIRIIIIYNR